MKFLKNEWLLVLLLWAIATLFNVNKAFHVDDTFHLEAAQWIQENPLRPMSGFINWENDPQPMHFFNQPPLYFYFIALGSSILGFGEVPLHLFHSLFVLLAIVFFYLLLVELNLNRRMLLLALFVLNPAFLINQNLMTDVPLLAFELAFLLFLVRYIRTSSVLYLLISGLALGMGLLVKYSLLPLLLVLPLSIILKKDFQKLGFALIPVAILGLWSVWNLNEFGAIHIFGRPANKMLLQKIVDSVFVFIMSVGAIVPFVWAWIAKVFSTRTVKLISTLLIGFALGAALFNVLSVFPENKIANALCYLFFVVGALVLGIWVYAEIKAFKTLPVRTSSFNIRLVFVLSVLGLSGFMILFAPFMATRHILLILPLLLLLGVQFFESNPWGVKLSLLSTVVLGVLLAISDWHYADYYRKMARQVEIPAHTKAWSLGHWGWQRYASQRGMETYSTSFSEPKAGDWIVFPQNYSKQILNPNVVTTLKYKLWEEPTVWTFVSGNDFASMYNSFFKKPPWTFSVQPIDTIFVHEVVEVKLFTSEFAE